MSSTARQAGAVHILFLIFTLVIAIAGWGLWFMGVQKAEDLEGKLREADREKVHFRERSVFAAKAYELIAPIAWEKLPKVCPYPDEDPIETPAEDVFRPYTDEARRDLTSLKDLIDAPGITPQTFRGAWGDIRNRYNFMKTEIQNKNLEIGRLQTEAGEKDTQIAQVNTSKTADRTKQDEEHAAALDNLKNQASQLRSQNGEFSDRNRVLTEEIRTTAEKASSDVQKAVSDKKALESQVQQVKKSLTIARATEAPDGNVIRADPSRGIVYIDIGSKQMLRAGTRFKVYETGKGGIKIPKGYIRVTRLDLNKSECRIDELGMGTIGPGDWLYNPYYDPKKKNHFFFLGELPGSWDRSTVSSVLKTRGAVIDTKVTVETDFLVMGVQEDEEAAPLVESDDYRRAKDFGIEIIRARDLTPYLKF